MDIHSLLSSRSRLVAVLAVAVAAALCPAQSSTSTVTYQGVLKENGTAVPPGARQLVFSIWDAASGGTAVQTIPQNVMIEGGGLFKAELPVDAASFNGADRWWSVMHQSVEMLPRQKVTATPYAMILGGTTNPTRMNVLNNLRASGGVQADGFAIGDWSFRGDAVRGVIPNWEGAPANLLTLVGSDAVTGGYSMARRPGVASPIIFFNDEPGNGFAVRAAAPGTSLASESRTFFQVNRSPNGSGQAQFGSAGVACSLTVFGEANVSVLTIRGADLAEKFDVRPLVQSNPAFVEPLPGIVVSIDPEHPGKLRVSSTAYDTKVAGAISGAGDLSVGALLGQGNTDPLISGDHPVAMSGRVYVWCDATFGAITAGDMLTTSTTPGHAMKAIDREKSFGAVIGKAMTGLKSGKGLVLVLVNLQ